jgi:hypothetical protein
MVEIIQQKRPNEAELVRKIHQTDDKDCIIQTTLQTNEQVIARVTDGIYRQPGSALRELISNAYDADATRVVIKTDAPRFGKIQIWDNGAGISPDALAHLLYNIGGSAKRNPDGEKLNITSHGDPNKSPKGRKLIGKIGIGLFSVSQLTQTFQIISKTTGDTHRTIATVSLRQFSDTPSQSLDSDSRYESGKVTIWRERVSDTASHGTTIILNGIRDQARGTLQSREIWNAIEQNEQSPDEEERQSIAPPRYHIGRVDESGNLLKPFKNALKSLPYSGSDKPAIAFQKLVNCVWGELENANPKPRLEDIFDYYLRMVWQLALAVPVLYVEGHLFDEPASGWTKTFQLSNLPEGLASELAAKKSQTIRDALDLKDPGPDIGKFEVFFDGLQLLRPIKYRNLPTTSHALKHPLVFLGTCEESFEEYPVELSGGLLRFEAYLFWSPKIVPTEHQGSLIRIHGASGTLFDSTFLRYQIAELTRLRQTTCEIFVSEGLDSALNIDRESFNSAHPHAVYLTKWLHNALRQLATTQKKESGTIRRAVRARSTDAHVSAIQEVASSVWSEESGDDLSEPPQVEMFDGEKASKSTDSYAFKRSDIISPRSETTGRRESVREAILEEKLKAIVQILASFGLLDRIPKRKQQKLLSAIYKILDEKEG